MPDDEKFFPNSTVLVDVDLKSVDPNPGLEVSLVVGETEREAARTIAVDG